MTCGPGRDSIGMYEQGSLVFKNAEAFGAIDYYSAGSGITTERGCVMFLTGEKLIEAKIRGCTMSGKNRKAREGKKTGRLSSAGRAAFYGAVFAAAVLLAHAAFVPGSAASEAGEKFVFRIETTEEKPFFALGADGADLTIDWGDGTEDRFEGTGELIHEYREPGEYDVSVSGTASRIHFHGGQWGTPELLKDILTPLYPAVKGITSAEDMFNGASAITGFTAEDWFDRASGNVRSMRRMFMEARNFNMDLNSWDTSSVENLSHMFYNARAFNGEIGGWDTSSVKDMGRMFLYARNVNSDISLWDTSSVEDMNHMFAHARGFNRDINTKIINQGTEDEYTAWDVSSVRTMFQMFRFARSFDRDISGWDISKVQNIARFLEDHELSTENYDKLLIAWSGLELQEGLTFEAGNSKYSRGLPAESRQKIIDEFNWEITDGGPAD